MTPDTDKAAGDSLPPKADTPLCPLCLDEGQETPGSCCVSHEIARRVHADAE